MPGRCPEVTSRAAEEDRNAGAPADPVFGEAGGRLWRDMTAAGELAPMQRALLVESCRIADRLDRLDGQLDGGEWLSLVSSEGGGEVTVIVDRLLAESRQQATALKQLVSEIRQAAGKLKTQKASAGGAEEQQKGSAGVADLTARIAGRRSSSAG